MYSNKIQLVKTAVSGIVAAGSAKIVSSIISNNTNPENVIDKVTMTAGSIALGGMVADITKRYTDAKIDELVELVKKIQEEMKS